nr:hypothetical protein GZ9C4_43 [uncultured archaeon GZfos9C4]
MECRNWRAGRVAVFAGLRCGRYRSGYQSEYASIPLGLVADMPDTYCGLMTPSGLVEVWFPPRLIPIARLSRCLLYPLIQSRALLRQRNKRQSCSSVRCI